VSAQELESLAGVRLTFDRSDTRSSSMGATGLAAKQGDTAAMNPATIAGTRSFSLDASRTTMEGRYIVSPDLSTIGIDSNTTGIRKASVTLPFAGLTWSLFYDQPLDVDHSTSSALGSGLSAPYFICDGHLSSSSCGGGATVLAVPATYPLDVTLNLKRYGAAAAWKSGPVAIGASLRREQLRQRSAFSTAILNQYTGTAETTDDSTLTWSTGATWDVTSLARVGASYSSGGSFTGVRSFEAFGPQPIEFRTPSTIGLGISVDPIPQVTLAADAVRVNYSEMMHGKRNLFPQGSEIGYDDVTELHAGAEYRVGSVAVRAGWWRDPAHALAIQNGVVPPIPFDYAAAIVDSDEDHITAGIGFGDKTKLNAAIDRGSRSTLLSLGVSTTF
jgi:long-chain fatty acid transport protein